MKSSVQSFVNTAEVGINRSERLFRRLTPAISETSKQFLSMASSAAMAALFIGGITFSISSLKDYETAVQSFRTIVSDLNDKEFSEYQKKINQVAKDTRSSSIQVAQSFEKIAGLNADFAKTSDGIGAVSQASIVLARAASMDLGSSAENLVGIMNQFSLAAGEADRTINVLAAGQAVGAANISQTAEAFVNFGSVAAGANITLEQSVGLVQTLGKYSIFGAEAGNKLKGSILRLQKSGVGYASGQFQINDALKEAKSRIDKLKTAKQKDAALNKMFGAENISTGRTLLSNIDLYEKFTKGVSGTQEAQKAAAINSATLTVKLEELKNGWTNILTASDKASSSLSTVKSVVGFLTDNLETIVSVGTNVILFFGAWKALLIISRIALFAYNIALGIYSALTHRAIIFTAAQTVAMRAQLITARLMTAALWAWNAAMAANPIGIVVLAIAGLVAIITTIIMKWNEWGAALSLFLGPLGAIISMVQSFRRNWDMISEAFSKGGLLSGLKAIAKVLFDSILMPIQQLSKIIAEWTGAQWAKNAVKLIDIARKNLGVNVTTDENGEKLQDTEAVNPEAKRQQAIVQRLEKSEQQNVRIDIADQTGRAKLSSDRNLPNIKLTSTLGWNGLNPAF
jgi:TP901 family phage tail tape measure protein